jgi:hypothetical protein
MSDDIWRTRTGNLLSDYHQEGLDIYLSECWDFYKDNGVTITNAREALAMDYREYIEKKISHLMEFDKIDWQEYTDIWLGNNLSQQELEGE